MLGDDPPFGQVPPLYLLCPRPELAGSGRSKSVRCRFHTCRPVYRGLARIAATVRSVHPAPFRCGFRAGSAADGHGTPASFKARVIRAALCRASRWPAFQPTIRRNIGAPLDQRGADLADELDSSPGPASREDTQQLNWARGRRART